jgi:hypothetical protein
MRLKERQHIKEGIRNLTREVMLPSLHTFDVDIA